MVDVDLTYPRVVLVALGSVVFLTVVAALLTSGTAFGAYNPAWDGTSELQTLADETGTEGVVVQNTTEYAATEANGTVAFVLSPETAYSSAQAASIEGFVRRGGTLVVAADYRPAGNDLLARLDADARFTGQPVRDERNYYRTPAMPLARNVSEHPLTAGVDRLTLNHGTEIEPGNATVLVSTSSYAYADENGNGELDDAESLQRRPVVTVERLGDGRVVAVADPSLFINTMLDRGGNRRFARNLLATHETAVFDVSHASGLPPLVALRLFLVDTPVAQAAVGLAILLALWAGARTLDSRRYRDGHAPDTTPVLDAEDRVAWLRERYPEWESDRLERVTKAVITRDDKPVDE